MRVYRTAEPVLARVAELPAQGWVVTDADGTLWAGDLAELAWSRAIEERRLRETAAAPMRRAVEAARVEPTGDVHGDAARLFDLYLEGVVDDWVMLGAMVYCYAGWTEAELRAFAREVWADLLAPRVYTTTGPLLAALLESGRPVAVVSGSPRVLVEEAVAGLGLSGEVPVLGVDVDRLPGDVLGERLRAPITWEGGKLEALRRHARARGEGHEVLVAFGDTGGDLPLLEAAAGLRVLVHPRPAIREHARQSDGPWCELAPTHTAGGDPVKPPTSDRVIDVDG